MAADRADKLFTPTAGSRNVGDQISISEVFYSPSRNSCVCEVSDLSQRKGGQLFLTLYDCLTREDLGETLIDINADFPQAQAKWNAHKQTLKAETPSGNK